MKIKIEYTMRILKNIKTLNDMFGKRRREGKIYGQYAILYRGSKRKEGSALKKSRSTIRNVRRRARGRLCCVPCIPFTVAFVYFYARMRNTLRAITVAENNREYKIARNHRGRKGRRICIFLIQFYIRPQ